MITAQLCAVLFFLSVYGLGVLIDPANRQPVAPRVISLPTKAEMMFDDNHGRG